MTSEVSDRAPIELAVEELQERVQALEQQLNAAAKFNEIYVRRLNNIQHELTAAGEEAERLQNGS